MNGSSDAFNFFNALPQHFSSKGKFAFATVIGSKGSVPQKVGSSALFNEKGLVTGTIGGGIVEFSVQKKAVEILNKKLPVILSFNLTNMPTENYGAICGGTMKILLDAMPEKHLSVFEAVKYSLCMRIPGIMVTYVQSNYDELFEIQREWIIKEDLKSDSLSLKPEIEKQAVEMFTDTVEGDFREVEVTSPESGKTLRAYMQTIIPPPRLIVAGAGHVGKILTHLGKILGFEVIVWDYRPEYATRDNLPDADLILNGEIETSLSDFKVDSNTYIIAVTTGHKKDTEVLRTFLNSGAGYIGMIGSRKKSLLMREQFLKEGWATPEQWQKIYSPVGLNINAESVEEIAVSIAAQLVQVRHELNKRK